MPRYALECEWDGSAANGTAPQPDGVPTFASIFLSACAAIGEATAQVRCSSRLDAGVSALALPAHVDLRKEWNIHALARALNVHLPACVAVRRVADLSQLPDWDALGAASSKHYRYRVCVQAWKPALDRRQMWLTRLPQSALLAEMAAHIIGEKDLSAFACLRGDESDARDPVRLYHAAEWRSSLSGDNISTGMNTGKSTDISTGTSAGRNGQSSESEFWEFHISGRGFLYKQVRGIVGTMIAVALGSYPLSEFERMLAEGRGSGQRSGNIAPAEALTLIRVDYDHGPQWQNIEWG